MNNLIALGLEEVKFSNPAVKKTTLLTYSRQLNKLYKEMKLQDKPFTFTTSNDKDISRATPDWWLSAPQQVLDWLTDKPWGTELSPRTIKNYINVLLTITRNHKEKHEGYKVLRKHFDTLKDSLLKKQELQLPAEHEKILKEITMEELSKGLNPYLRNCKSSSSTDLLSATYYMLGHLHLDQVLRNEPMSMVLTNEYLNTEDFPDTNFIWNKGRNSKLMVIRNNKIRNPAKGHPAKEVKLTGLVNSAINKYIKVLKNNDKWEDPMPLLTKEITSSGYGLKIKKIWGHKGYEITSTMIRKLYAMEMRKEFGGVLTKEKEACDKLDHSLETHNYHYILNWD